MAGLELWTISIQNLMLCFRDALAALTPSMDRVKIGWRDEEAYDDWDEIAQCLYQNMVLRSVRFSLDRPEGFTTPEYGTVYPSYGDKSFIEVPDSSSPLGEYRVFVGFATLRHPFDQIRCVRVSGPDLRALGEANCIPLEGSLFMFMFSTGAGQRTRLSEISVEV